MDTQQNEIMGKEANAQKLHKELWGITFYDAFKESFDNPARYSMKSLPCVNDLSDGDLVELMNTIIMLFTHHTTFNHNQNPTEEEILTIQREKLEKKGENFRINSIWFGIAHVTPLFFVLMLKEWEKSLKFYNQFENINNSIPHIEESLKTFYTIINAEGFSLIDEEEKLMSECINIFRILLPFIISEIKEMEETDQEISDSMPTSFLVSCRMMIYIDEIFLNQKIIKKELFKAFDKEMNDKYAKTLIFDFTYNKSIKYITKLLKIGISLEEILDSLYNHKYDPECNSYECASFRFDPIRKFHKFNMQHFLRNEVPDEEKLYNDKTIMSVFKNPIIEEFEDHAFLFSYVFFLKIKNMQNIYEASKFFNDYLNNENDNEKFALSTTLSMIVQSINMIMRRTYKGQRTDYIRYDELIEDVLIKFMKSICSIENTIDMGIPISWSLETAIMNIPMEVFIHKGYDLPDEVKSKIIDYFNEDLAQYSLENVEITWGK